jgi:uncharacterized protein YxjI
MDVLESAKSLVVKQRKEWGEIVTDIEQRNKYVVSDPAGSELFLALESGGSPVARWLLRNLRPFDMELQSLDRRAVLQLHRPFRWFFHELEVRDAQSRALGTVKRRYSWFRRVYDVADADRRHQLQLFGPATHPWTFEIRQGGRVVGRIVKKWGGLAKEAFTDADTFGITFPPDSSAGMKALLLGAVFLIDFVHFENSK